MTKKLSYKRLSLEFNPKLKLLRAAPTAYIVILGNARNHTTYSDWNTSVYGAWKDCFEKLIKS